MPLSPRKQLRPMLGKGPLVVRILHKPLIMTGSWECMSLKAGNHHEKVVKSLNALRQVETLCDYRLKAGGLSLPVHKVVLIACSDYFLAMMTSNMKECRENEVELKGISANGLKIIVDFLYTGEISLTLQNVEDVLLRHHTYKFMMPHNYAAHTSRRPSPYKNCVDILNLAKLYSLSSLQEVGKQFILKKIEELAESEQYPLLNDRQLVDILNENGLRVISEFVLFNIVLKWIQHSLDEKEQFIADLMKNI